MKKISILILISLPSIIHTLHGQPLHMAPPYLSDYGKDSVILSIKIDTTGISSIVISDQTFFINFDNGAVEVHPILHKSVSDLCNAMNLKYKSKITLLTNYPHIDASRIESKIITPVEEGSTYTFPFGKIKPSILIDFGAQLSLAQNETQLTSNSLLNQAGFNLDLIGQQRFRIGGNWGLYTALRLGFSSNMNLLVSDSISNNQPDNTGGQIEAAIRQAGQALLNGYTEFTFGFIKSKSIQIGSYMEGGFTYYRLNPIDLTNRKIFINDTTSVPYIGTISQEALDRFNRFSTKAFPIGYGEAGLNFRFIRDYKMLGYGGLGIGVRPEIIRGVRYRFLGETRDLDTNYLEHSISVSGHNWFLRPKIGLNLAQIIDLRVEALVILGKKGIDRNSNNNMFRIVITRDFPVK